MSLISPASSRSIVFLRSLLKSEKAWHQAVVFRDGRIQRVPIDELMGPARLVDADHRWVQMAHAVGIFC